MCTFPSATPAAHAEAVKKRKRKSTEASPATPATPEPAAIPEPAAEDDAAMAAAASEGSETVEKL